MDSRNTPIKVCIEIDLLLFRDGLRHIDNSLHAGHITMAKAHELKNNLAGIYADRIVQLIDERGLRTNG